MNDEYSLYSLSEIEISERIRSLEERMKEVFILLGKITDNVVLASENLKLIVENIQRLKGGENNKDEN